LPALSASCTVCPQFQPVACSATYSLVASNFSTGGIRDSIPLP